MSRKKTADTEEITEIQLDTPKTAYDGPVQLTLFFPEETTTALAKRSQPLVWMSNYLARAVFYSQTVWTERVFVAACSQIKKDEEVPDIFYIGIPEISPNRSGQLYNGGLLENITDELTDEKIRIKFPDETGNVHGSMSVNIFAGAVYSKDKNMLAVILTEPIKKYVTNQTGVFTTLNKKEFMQLNTIYAQRLFRFLSSNRYNGDGTERVTYTVLVPVLMQQLNPPEWCTKFTEFERRILKPALQNINKCTSLGKVGYEKIVVKGSKKIHSICFTFGDIIQVDGKGSEKQIPEKTEENE